MQVVLHVSDAFRDVARKISDYGARYRYKCE